MWETDASGNQVWVPATTLPSDVQPFDNSNYWQADEQTSGSVTQGDILSFLKDYPEYTSFFGNQDIINMLSTAGGAAAKGILTSATTGKIDPAKIAALVGGAGLGLAGLGNTQQQKVGYQGGIPTYTAVREQVPGTYDPNRRPGSRGQEYMTDTQYVKPTDVATAQAASAQQAKEMEARNKARAAPASAPTQSYAGGGIAALAGGNYLAGGTDGMADQIPATIAGKQPAKLSHGEFVVSADVVSALGGGNSEAGAKRLYDMMDRIRTQAHGKKEQIKPVNPKKVLPA